MRNLLLQKQAEVATGLPPIRFVKAPEDKEVAYLLVYVDTAKFDLEWSKDDGFYIPRGGTCPLSATVVNVFRSG